MEAYTEYQLNQIVSSLKDAVRVVNQAYTTEMNDGLTKTFQYAAGYASSALQSAIRDLEEVIESNWLKKA